MSKHRTITQTLLTKFLSYGYLVQGEFKAEPYHSVKRPHWCPIREDAKEIRVRLYTSDIRDHGKQKYILLSKPIDPSMKFRVVERYYDVLGTALTDERTIKYFCDIKPALVIRDGWIKRPNVAACWIEEVFDYANH